MELLAGPIRTYAWGSHTALARLRGQPGPTRQPEAELWLGAHPASPALLLRPEGQIPLTAAIEAEPEMMLGEATLRGFGRRLPFLMKVLAAAEPLSIQAHPDSRRAAEGFAREEAEGLARDAAERTYVDAYHKPEILVAVEPFDALCGFRDPLESAELLARLDLPELAAVGKEGIVAALRAPDPAIGLRTAVEALLTLPDELRKPLVDAVIVACGPLRAEHASYDLAVRLAELYQADVGVVVAMLLNRMRLEPGQAVWMPSGNLHAYLEGVGVEVMAASDNVLRGGLTPKRVNVPELLRALRFEVLADPVVRPVELAPGVVTWPVPIADFALVRATLSDLGGPVSLPGFGPRVVLCLAGTPCVDDGAGAVGLRGGLGAFAAAAAGPVTVTGEGVVFQASVGEC
jgi:mannose-6-phosphate isomerase